MSSGLETRPGAQTFRLDDLVEHAWTGRIRVPHFQRGFRWAREDVVRLVDSVRRRYPVGSVLLWRRPAPARQITLGALSIPGPEVQEALWVVDGQQRITSLANVLHPEGHHDPRFALGFDLRTESIVPLPGLEHPFILPLPVVFDLSKVLQWSADRPEIADVREHAFAFSKQLREFTIPAYIVVEEDVRVPQDIFDRMNNYGKRLSRAEIFSALTAGTEAGAEQLLTLGRIADDVEERLNFGRIDDDTVLRAVLARRGPDIQREIRDEFGPNSKAGQEFPGEDRDTAFAQGAEALDRAVMFLQEQGVPHMTLLPYRYLLVVLARAFAHHPEPDAANRRLLARWYWQAAVHGPTIFKGSTTATGRALCARVRPGDLSGSIRRLFDALADAPEPSLDLARFRTNQAAGKIMLCALWHLGPRNPEDGQPYTGAELAARLSGQGSAADVMRDLVARSALPEQFRGDSPANRVLLPDVAEDGPALSGLFQQRPLGMDDHAYNTTLTSHVLTAAMIHALNDGDVDSALALRQAALSATFRSFVEAKGEWTFENTPSLADLEIADLAEEPRDDAA